MSAFTDSEHTTVKESGMRQTFAYAVAVLALAAGLLTALASPALASEVTSLSVSPSTTQAGGHPDVTIRAAFTYGNYATGERQGDARRIATHLPTGVIGNPHAIPTCSLLAFSLGECPPDSQVGVAGANPLFFAIAPLYNMETKPDQAGLLAFKLNVGGTQQYIEISGRTDSDYGLDSISTTIFHSFPISELFVQLWGVPADPSHDRLRFIPPVAQDCSLEAVLGETSCSPVAGAKATVPPEPYLQNPTTCGISLTSSLDVEFYNHVTASASSPWPATTGCDQLAFNPSLTVKPTTEEGDTASGLDADLKVPQIANPYTPSPSEIRGVTVTLPKGFSINPNAADGKKDCSDADTAIGTLHGATCPDFSKVGTLSIDSSALPGPIPGAIYLGEPKPGDPYRLILAADGDGTHVKLAGSAHADPQTGQIEVSFKELPQSPLTEFNMHFFGSERGLLATPTQCGTYPVESEFEPWDAVLPNQSSTSFFHIGSGPRGSACPNGPRPFSPKLTAGTANPTAGRHTQFNLELSREDGEQNLTGLTVLTPLGFSGTLAGIPYCPESALAQLASRSGILEQAEPLCPLESQIGTAIAGAGAGTHPLYTPGKVYLAGPYKGAPLSLEVVIPAVSGPYDLGNVAVRAAIKVDPVTARVTTVSDPLPQILGGIPLRTRSIRVELNRPEFALNPTNCAPLATEARVTGSEGALTSPSAHFQVGNCALLPFGPKLDLKLKGGTGRNAHPALSATLTAKPGEANIASSVVTMPHSIFLDNAHINAPCTRVQYAANACPASSVLGSAKAESPLLAQPLEGPVYLRSNPEHELPDLVVALKGQIDIELAARIDSVHERLRTSFETVPDVPVSKFTLNLLGGNRGLLVTSENICKATQRAAVKMGAQNGKGTTTATKLQTPCGSKARHKRQARKRKVG
jgi:hypothetical protein